MISRVARLVKDVGFMAVLLLAWCRLADSRRAKNRQPTIPTIEYIVGGMEAPEGRFPYMCALFSGRKYKCGGTLIDPQWVLTVAHCVDANKFDAVHNPIVFCGAYSNITDYNSTQATSVTKTYIHSRFNGRTQSGYDIALLKLKEPFDLPTPLLNLGSRCEFKDGQQLSAIGWGYDGESSGSAPSETLMHAPAVNFVSKKKCNSDNVYKNNIRKHQLCAGVGRVDACRGDSGGPLLIPHRRHQEIELGNPAKDLIVGLVSFGPEICGSERPGVYTSVFAFGDWIVKKTGKRSLRKESENCAAMAKEMQQSMGETEGSYTARQTSIQDRYTGETDDAKLKVLIQAIGTDDAELVEVMLDLNVDPDSPVDDVYLLHFAAEMNAVRSIQLLVEYGADVEIKDEKRNTPLQFSCHFGQLEAAQVLLDNDADPDTRDSQGFTPLHRACFFGHTSIVNELIRFEANVNIQSSTKLTPLYFSASRGDYKIVRSLIEAGADPTIEDASGKTPYQVVCTADEIQCTSAQKQKTENYLG